MDIPNSQIDVVRCSAIVFGERVQHWRCTKKAKVERNGKWYCGTHDPEARAAKQKIATQKRAAANAVQDSIHKQAQALAIRLGCGIPHWQHRWRGESGYSQDIVISFDDVEALLKVLGRS